MTRQITVFLVPDDEDNEAALNVVGRLSDADLVRVHCPDSMSESYPCPFIRDEQGTCYFGLEGIRLFVDRISSSGGGTEASVAKA